MSSAIFLDRDGVINEIVYHQEVGIIDTPFNPEQFKLLPGVGEAINSLNSMKLKVILVSNQPGIAKNQYSLDIFEGIRSKMNKELSNYGAFFDSEYYCFHHPDAKNLKYRSICECRKPKPGMLFKAKEELDIDLENSWMVGDSLTDIKAGKSVGCRTIFIGTMKCDLCRLMQKENIEPDFIVPSLIEVPDIIKGGTKYENISRYCEH